jgi:DNA-binding transcriptional LysR family regulator
MNAKPLWLIADGVTWARRAASRGPGLEQEVERDEQVEVDGARLRSLLGEELLVRAGQRLVPTPRAEALAAPVRALIADTERLLAPPGGFDPASLRRAFRVACTDHVSTVLLRVAEPRYRAEAPGVDLHEHPVAPDTLEQLRAGAIDVAIGVFPDAPPEVRTRPERWRRRSTAATSTGTGRAPRTAR